MSALKYATQTFIKLSRAQLSLHNFTVINRSLATSVTSEKFKKSQEWDPIFKFEYIQGLASLNRAKVYQIALSAIVIPISFAVPEVLDPLVVSYLGVTGALTLSLASYVLRNTIGFIYISNKNPDLVKFAYVTFWGGRKDVEMKVEDVVPFSQLPRSVLDSYLSVLQFKNGHPNMKLFYKLGGVRNSDEFSRVFGEEN